MQYVSINLYSRSILHRLVLLGWTRLHPSCISIISYQQYPVNAELYQEMVKKHGKYVCSQMDNGMEGQCYKHLGSIDRNITPLFIIT